MDVQKNKLRKYIARIISESVSGAYDINNLSYSELRDIARWGLEGEYSESACWDDTFDLETAINCAIQDFKQFLSTPFPKELGNVPAVLTIFRIVRLKDVSLLNKQKLGHSWFSNPEQYKVSGFFDMLDYLKAPVTSDGKTYLLEGLTNSNNVDVPRTLWERSTQWAENEIVIKDDSQIKLVSVKKMSKL